jgi:DNA-binding GntR family transcriptional regulator
MHRHLIAPADLVADADAAVDVQPLLRLMRAAEAHHRTAFGVVTETLRGAIIDGIIPPGTPLRQDSLAATLGTSRMPLREAIRQLEGEGLVDFVPHRGAVVARLRAEDVEELADLRIALEQLSLRLSLTHLDPAAFDRAEAVLAEIDTAPTVAQRNVLNRQFHAILYSGVQRPRLERHVATLYDAFDRYLRIAPALSEELRGRRQQEHRRLLDACRRHNLAVALGELASHIGDSCLELAALLRARIAPPTPATATGWGNEPDAAP